MRKPTVFIQANAAQRFGAQVAAHSFKKMSKHPDAFDVELIELEHYPQLMDREGQVYRRKGRDARWTNRDLQSFSPLRFLPPQIMGYQGRAVVVDPDVFAIDDIYELLTLDMEGKAVRCRLTQTSYGNAPFYATSVMLLDCDKLSHWNWDRWMDEMFAGEWDYGDWISLRRENPDIIGLLPEYWNHLDVLTRETKMLHNTERSTQPWKTGLPVDYDMNYKNAAPKKKKGVARLWQKLMGQPRHEAVVHTTPERYLPHPDPRQERFFFSMLRSAMADGDISEDWLREEIRIGFIRPDAFELLANLPAYDPSELETASATTAKV